MDGCGARGQGIGTPMPWHVLKRAMDQATVKPTTMPSAACGAPDGETPCGTRASSRHAGRPLPTMTPWIFQGRRFPQVPGMLPRRSDLFDKRHQIFGHARGVFQKHQMACPLVDDEP